MKQNTEGEHYANPYALWLRGKAPELATRSPLDTVQSRSPFAESYMVHIRQDSEWTNANVANALLALCASANEGAFPANAAEFFEHLLEKSWDNRWYHGERGMGDMNTDRFVMLPFLESFLIARHHLSPALRGKLEERITGILEAQYERFGESGQSTKVYPNMDFYYCAIMMLGWHLFGEARFSSEFERYIHHLEKAQFAGGGWTYIKGTNECANYHQLNVCVLGRILQFTGHDAARRQMERTVDFYPTTATPTGLLEGHTDVWWKHDWKQPGSFPLDIVASMTGDGRNRTLADLLRDRTMHWLDQVSDSNMRGTETGLLYCYYASLVWKDIAPQPVPEESLLLDENIRGPRVHAKGWSWAATSGYECDTVVGAVAHKQIDGKICALVAVTPEIPYLPTEAEAATSIVNNRWDFAVLPAGTEGRTKIDGNKTSFEIEYQPESCRSFWKGPGVHFEWQVRQKWQMDGNSLLGTIRLVSLKDQNSTLPVVRIRFGRGHQLQTLSDTSYRYGCFVLTLDPGDFAGCSIREVPTMALELQKDAVEILLVSDIDHPHGEIQPVARDLTFSMNLRLEYSP